MLDLRTALTIVFSVELGVAGLAGIGYALTLLSYWNLDTNPGKRVRSILASSCLAAALVTGLSVFYLVETRSHSSSTVGANFHDISLTRWIVYAGAFGAAAYALAQFYRMRDTIKWVFVVSIALAMGLFAVATQLSDDSATRRWTFFGFGLVAAAVAIVIQLMADTFYDGTDPAKSDEERLSRGFIRIWVAVTWMSMFLWWFLGPFGIDRGTPGTFTFENSAYVINEFFALWIPLGMGFWTFSPLLDVMRNSEIVTKAAQWVDRRGGALLGGNGSSTRGTTTTKSGKQRTRGADVLVVRGSQSQQ